MAQYRFEYSYNVKGSYTADFESDHDAIAFLEEVGSDIREYGDDYDWDDVDEDEVEIDEVSGSGQAVRSLFW